MVFVCWLAFCSLCTTSLHKFPAVVLLKPNALVSYCFAVAFATPPYCLGELYYVEITGEAIALLDILHLMVFCRLLVVALSGWRCKRFVETLFGWLMLECS
jgi:hypothetical protein